MSNRLRRAYTLVELLVSVVVVALLVAMLLPLAACSNELQARRDCGANLRQIGLAMLTYAQDQRNGAFPRVAGSEALVSGGFGAVADGSVPASAFLLVRHQAGGIKADAFVCPSTRHRPDPLTGGAGQLSFAAADNLSYGFSDPWGSPALGYRWNNNVSTEFAIVADRNDGAPGAGVNNTHPAAQLRGHNSRNHGQLGQNILYGDGHTEWHDSPFGGARRSHIYIATAAFDGQPPADMTTSNGFVPTWSMDTVILPRP